MTLTPMDKHLEKFRQVTKEFWRVITREEEQNDRRERMEVYAALAKALSKRLQQPDERCLDAVHALVAEKDPLLIKTDAPVTEALLTQIQNTVLKISVRYVRDEDRHHWREIELYELHEGKALRSIIREERAWDALPADVREDQLREGGTPVIFKLYPRD